MIDWDLNKAKWLADVKKHGKPYSEQNEAGYIYKGARVRMWLLGPTIKGAEYKPDGCDCGLPSWEICREVCEHAIR